MTMQRVWSEMLAGAHSSLADKCGHWEVWSFYCAVAAAALQSAGRNYCDQVTPAAPIQTGSGESSYAQHTNREFVFLPSPTVPGPAQAAAAAAAGGGGGGEAGACQVGGPLLSPAVHWQPRLAHLPPAQTIGGGVPALCLGIEIGSYERKEIKIQI